MSAQSPFILPLRGLGQGVYTYDLICDDAFFASFEHSPVDKADIRLTLTVDRSSRDLSLRFEFTGTVATTCDRCMADIDLPIEGQRALLAKFVPDAAEMEDEADLIFLDADTNLFNAAPYAYELILLEIPMIRTYACREGVAPYPCDEDMLARIDDSIDGSAAGAEPSGKGDDNDKPSPWDVLKDLQ